MTLVLSQLYANTRLDYDSSARLWNLCNPDLFTPSENIYWGKITEKLPSVTPGSIRFVAHKKTTKLDGAKV